MELLPELWQLIIAELKPCETICLKYTSKSFHRIVPPLGDRKTKLSIKLARNGYLAVLQWARANGCPWDESICAYVAKNGYLAVLQWARANGCPWDESTCAQAAWNGHLEVLQWARANGCPSNESTCYYASKKGHLE